MIIGSSLKFSEEQQNRDKFSKHFTQYVEIFANYSANTALRYRFPNPDFYIRMQKPSYLDYAITLWVIGYMWQELHQMYQMSLKCYFLSSSNILNFSMSVLYISSFGLKYYTIVNVALHRAQISSAEFWKQISKLSPNDFEAQKEIYETFYWLNDGIKNT
jgi:hypothetical protein